MSIIRIETPGIKIRVEGESLVYPEGAQLNRVPLRTIKALILTPGIGLSSDLIIRASQNNVFIIIVDFHGRLKAYIAPTNYRGNVALQREQIRAYDDQRGTYLAKTWTRASIQTRAWLLEYLARNRKDKPIADTLLLYKERVEEYLDRIESVDGHVDRIRGILMQYEMQAANLYYDAIRLLIPPEYGFVSRRYPARDPANATISYANSILRSRILIQVLISGLNPSFGYLHADYNRYNLVLDLSEEFIVPIAHLTAIKLLERKQIRIVETRRSSEGYFLDYPAKLKIITEIHKQLERKVGNRRVSTLIKEQTEKLSKYLRGETRYDIVKII